jgi:putative molybdopterin biosynthesis protein
VSGGPEEFLTVADIARTLKVNQQTVRNWIDGSRLPALRVGRRVRVRRADFDAFVERGRTVPAPAAGRSQAQAFWDGEFHPTPVVPVADEA